MDRRFLLLVNPAAGGGRGAALAPRIEAAMRACGLEHRTVLTRSVEHGCEEALAGVAAGETPVVASGDGLIGQVGGALAGGAGALGLIPAGRGNDLARVLGIPVETESAVAVLADAHVREIDVGVVNGRRFLGIAGCGFDSDANRIANEAKLVRGQLVYAYAALRALAGWRPATFTLTLDGERVVLLGYGVAAANSRAYGGGMFVAPAAELDDGLLEVVTSAATGKVRFLTQLLPRVFKGTHVELPEVEVRRGRELRIEADRPFAVYADGDHLADLPADVTLMSRALRVIVPAA